VAVIPDAVSIYGWPKRRELGISIANEKPEPKQDLIDDTVAESYRPSARQRAMAAPFPPTRASTSSGRNAKDLSLAATV